MKGTRVGFTSSIPVEAVLAAGAVPVDLNNVFIRSPDPHLLIRNAEEAGFPRTVCSWIKGIYSAVVEREDIPLVIGVTQGDCSNTHALLEVLEKRGKEVWTFEYPRSRTAPALRKEVERLMNRFGVDWESVRYVKTRLDRIRRKLILLDRLTWEAGKVTGEENHIYLVSSSDFNGDPDAYEEELDRFLLEAGGRPELPRSLRLGYAGVPPIVSGLYGFLESKGARVVFNEVQRQFAMPYLKKDLIDQYLAYTYPYHIQGRIDDIREAVRTRRLHGLIHYAQSFCFRQIQDLLLREELEIPILTLEGDRPGVPDAQTLNRIEAFLEVIA